MFARELLNAILQDNLLRYTIAIALDPVSIT